MKRSDEEKVERMFHSLAKRGIVLSLRRLVLYCKRNKISYSYSNLLALRKKWLFLATFAKPPRTAHYMGMAIQRYGVVMLDLAIFTKAKGVNVVPWISKLIEGKHHAFLIGVECLSGKIACVPVKDKSAKSWEYAITKMLAETFHDIRLFISDRDAVATSEKFREKILQRHGVEWRFQPARGKAIYAERYIRFMRRRLAIALMGTPEARDWSPFVDGIVEDFNKEPIAGTEISRGSVNKDNYVSLLEKLYKSTEPTMLFNVSCGSNVKDPGFRAAIWKYRVGQRVLVKRSADYTEKQGKGAFVKTSAVGSYSTKVRTISRTLWKTSSDYWIVPIYELEGLIGKFYESDLLPVSFQDGDADADD